MPTWKEVTNNNPSHSENYAARWRKLAAAGNDIYGEARLIDAMAPRGARILDAGCGQGRIGGYLAHRGHQVHGVDIDPILINYANLDFPEAKWTVGDLVADPLPTAEFDLIVSAGNVMGFIAEAGHLATLANLHQSLKPTGRAVIGFGSGRGWDFKDFLAQAEAVGWNTDSTYSSWELHPFTPSSTFLVAVLSPQQLL